MHTRALTVARTGKRSEISESRIPQRFLAPKVPRAGDAAGGEFCGTEWSNVVRELLDALVRTAEQWLVRLPIVRPPVPVGDRGVCCIITTIDDRGRLASRSLVRALGWESGTRFQIYPLSEMVIVTPWQNGVELITRHGYIRLPPAVRRGLALGGGDRVLLMASSEHQLLVGFTMSALVVMSVSFCANLAEGAR